MMHWMYVATCILLLACKEQTLKPPISNDVPPALHYPTVLPQEIVSSLRDSFPQWQIVEKSDYSKVWWSFFDSSYNPCWARTDINDDQLADYAIWLKKDAQLRLLICTGKTNTAFNHTIAIDSNNMFIEKEHNLSMGIAVASPAQIDIVQPQIQSLILRSNGFALMELEAQTRIYYWENGRIQTFYMK